MGVSYVSFARAASTMKLIFLLEALIQNLVLLDSGPEGDDVL